MKSIVIKLSSALILQTDTTEWLDKLAVKVAELKKQNFRVVLVTSGATALGKKNHSTPKEKSRQFYAIIGQPILFSAYQKAFSKVGLSTAQVLVDKDNFRNRSYYLKIRSGLNELLHEELVPLLNENDVIAEREFAFSDNDEIAGLVASLLGSERLVLASSVEGLLDDKRSLVTQVESGNHSWRNFVDDKTSQHGRGGMALKCLTAERVAARGIAVTICSGLNAETIFKASMGENIGTVFLANKHLTAKKRWILDHSQFADATIVIDARAAEVMLDKTATSLLSVGVKAINGEFEVNDVVMVVDQNDIIIGYGQTQYSSREARKLIGKHAERPLIHYDYYVGNQL